MAAKPKILLVDDESNVTRALSMVLRREYDVVTAESGEEGLRALDEQGPFAVALSDMRMPRMNGAQFLAQVYQRAPDTSRILLTGQADAESAALAINEGRIHRFLNKPCAPTPLRKALADAVEQNRLRNAERDLLENTLTSSLKVLVDILGITRPEIASYAERVHSVVKQLVKRLELEPAWLYETAATLSHLGCVSLPDGLLDRFYSGTLLEEKELGSFEAHPGLGAEILSGIPRLEVVAAIIERQHDEPRPEEVEGPLADWPEATVGGELLRYAVELMRQGDVRPEDAVAALGRTGSFPPELVEAAVDLELSAIQDRPIAISTDELRIGMSLVEDVVSKDGVLLAKAGANVNGTLLTLLLNFFRHKNLTEPIVVYAQGTDGQLNEADHD